MDDLLEILFSVFGEVFGSFLLRLGLTVVVNVIAAPFIFAHATFAPDGFCRRLAEDHRALTDWIWSF